MITEEVFRKTEGRIYRYYWMIKQIDKLKHKAVVLYQHTQSIERDIRETNITLEPESKSVVFSERVQTSSSGSSYAESEFMKAMFKLEREHSITKKKLLKTRARIREFEKEIADMQYTISQLTEECKQFVEIRYGSRDKVSFIALGRMLNISEATARRRREEIVEDIAKWLNVS